MFAEVIADHRREQRTGVGEVIFGQGKSLEQIAAAVTALRDRHPVLVTRLADGLGQALARRFPEGSLWTQAGLICIGREIATPCPEAEAEVIVVTAGTTDLPVAREALGSALFFDLKAHLVADVGVAGIHRLMERMDLLQRARVVIAVAGMEGALPSVLGGLIQAPLIAVPTSVGYGASFGGMAALLAMLNSCAPGIGVVNIDNGFGAAALAKKIMGVRTAGESRPKTEIRKGAMHGMPEPACAR